MMQKNSLNKVMLIGRLGARPEGRYTKQGRSVVSFSIATNESWNSADGSLVEHTEWHNVVAWGKLADFATEYLQKGQLIHVEGTLRTRLWDDKEGLSHKTTEIICSNIVAL
jgi:single-strand DNA-binding protein